MKPITLKIKGLNSFIEEQTIDFEKLTSKGLFGIFGPTGSGKSTILDAITLALYGEISRKSSNCINTSCDELLVSYEFQILNNGIRKNYIVERNIKRDKNETIKTRYCRIIEKSAYSEERVIGEGPREVKKCCEDIIGLSCEDFTRSVVLPQGKFSEFLKLKGSDRRDMLERIFGLQKYGKNIVGKVRSAKHKVLDEQNILIGKLSKYKDLTEEAYKDNKERLIQVESQEKELKLKEEQISNRCEELKNLRELTVEFNRYKKEEQELNINKKEIEEDRIRLERGKASFTIKPFIVQYNENINKYKLNEEELLKYETVLDGKERELDCITSNYKIVERDKNEKLPNLYREQKNAERAIELNKQCKELKNEKEDLLSLYRKLNKEKNEKEEQLKLVEINIFDAEESEGELNKKIDRLQFSNEYKELLDKTVLIKRDYVKELEELREKESKIKEKEEHIDVLGRTQDNILVTKEQKEKELNVLQEKLNNLSNNFPGHNNLLFKLKDEINVLEEKVRNKENLEIKLKEEQAKLRNIEEKVKNSESDHKSLEEVLCKKSDQCERLKDEIQELTTENMAYIIATKLVEGEPCPVCGSNHHEIKAEKVDLDILKERENTLIILQKEIEEEKKKFNERNTEFQVLKKQKEILKENIDNILNAFNKEDLNKDLNKELAIKKEQFIKSENDIEQSEKEKNFLEEQIKQCINAKQEMEKEDSRLCENIRIESKTIFDLKSEVKFLQEKVKKASESLELCIKELELEDLDFLENKVLEIKNIERQLTLCREKLKKISEDKKMFIKNKDELVSIINKYSSEIESLVKVGKEKSNNIDKITREIIEITDGEEPVKVLEAINRKIENIEIKYKELKIKFENTENEVKILKENVLRRTQEKITLKELCNKTKKEIEDRIIAYKFLSIDECLELYLDEKQIMHLEEKIRGYEDRVKETENNIKRVSEKLNKNFIDEEMLVEVLKKKEEIGRLHIEKIREKASLEQSINDMGKDLEEFKNLKKEENKINHTLSLINDLDKLLQGNKFVEFASLDKLKYISMGASKRLRDITANRYSLEIDGQGNFTIRDDTSGGAIRDCSTLSGGETFLTSLALALSLSSQIQLKGSAPLEFFFLDEGFGTLDPRILDDVMNSLEKLHSDRMAVGIISHVEELKNRVPMKLIVTPRQAGEGGTKVSIEIN